MAITILNEWEFTEYSGTDTETSDIVTPYSKINIYYRATKTNVAYSTISPDNGVTIFRAIELTDLEDATYKYFLFNGEDYFKYKLLEDAIDTPIWKSSHGYNYVSIRGIYDQQVSIIIKTFNNSDVEQESFLDKFYIVSIFGQKLPSKYGFNLFELYNNNHFMPLKWSNNTFNIFFPYGSYSLFDTKIINLTTGKTLYDSVGTPVGVSEMYFPKKVQDVYPYSTLPTKFHKEGNSLDTSNIEVDGGTYGAGEIEKVNLNLDKTIYSDDNGDDKSVVLSLQYGNTSDGDGSIGALILTADPDFTYNNCLEADTILQSVNLTSAINLGIKHIIFFEHKRNGVTPNTVEIFDTNISIFWDFSDDVVIEYQGQPVFISSLFQTINFLEITIVRDGFNISTTIEEIGIQIVTQTATLTSNDDLISVTELLNDDFERIGNIKIYTDFTIMHWWKCNLLVGGDIPDEGNGDVDFVISTQQKDSNVNRIELELIPGLNHATLGGDILAYLDNTVTPGGTGHIYIDNIELLSTFTPEYDDGILASGLNKLELLLCFDVTSYHFPRIIEIDYDPYGCYNELLFHHPQLGFVSYPFEGMEIETLSTRKGDELTPFRLTMIDVNALKEILGYDANVKISLSAQVEKKYWDIVKEIYNSRYVYLYVGNNGDIDSQDKWIQVEISGSPNMNYNTNQSSALFTVNLELPTKLNNRF